MEESDSTEILKLLLIFRPDLREVVDNFLPRALHVVGAFQQAGSVGTDDGRCGGVPLAWIASLDTVAVGGIKDEFPWVFRVVDDGPAERVFPGSRAVSRARD